MLLASSVYLWRRGDAITQKLRAKDDQGVLRDLAEAALPLSLSASAMGLGLIAIAIAGVHDTLLAAPPQEPLSGHLANRPRIEATFVSSLFALTGLGAFPLPFMLRSRSRGLRAIISV